jgi:hypothetical protein
LELLLPQFQVEFSSKLQQYLYAYLVLYKPEKEKGIRMNYYQPATKDSFGYHSISSFTNLFYLFVFEQRMTWIIEMVIAILVWLAIILSML